MVGCEARKPPLGFEERIRGSHRIFKRDDVEEIMTLQMGRPIPEPKGRKLMYASGGASAQ